ncbi:MAG: response regulator, partial [Acidobacteria bacterium]
MAQLATLIVTSDEDFRREASRLLRSGGVPVGILEGKRPPGEQTPPDLALVDLRTDASAGMAAIERLRASLPSVTIFAVAVSTEPQLILQAMRSGANEFFTWPPDAEAFHGAIRRTAQRRETLQVSAKPPSATLVFFGAKGGAGTTTIAVNCAVELARITS